MSQPAETIISVEVVYALAEQQALVSVQVPQGATAEQAILRSGLLERFADIDLKSNKLAIWYRSARLDAELKNGDRVMILRPLIADPKEIRRRRAEEAKERAGGKGAERPERPARARRSARSEPEQSEPKA